MKFQFRLLVALMFILISLPLVSSAWEWDNVGSYDNETKTMEIINAFGLGDTIAFITLESPLDMKVIRGEERLVAWYNLENFEQYPGDEVFGVIETLDLKRGMSPITKNFVYKIKNYETVQAPNWVYNCSMVYKEDIADTVEVCERYQDGTVDKVIYEWKAFNKNNLLEAGNYTIGLFIEVELGEYVEWIPNLYGVRIDEWASWQESFNTGLRRFYFMNTTYEVIQGQENLTIREGSPTFETSLCLTQGCANVSVDNIWNVPDSGNTDVDFLAKNITMNLWIRSEGSQNGRHFLSRDATQYISIEWYDNGDLYFDRVFSTDGVKGEDIPRGVWHMITLVINDTTTTLYQNGTKTHSQLSDEYLGETGAWALGCAANGGGCTSDMIRAYYDAMGWWNYTLSDVTIAGLYDATTPPEYVPATPPTVNLVFPENTTYNENVNVLNYTISDNGQSCWYSTNGGTTNSTPIVCGANFTITASGGSNTWWIFTNTSAGLEAHDNVTFVLNNTVITILSYPTTGLETTNPNVDFEINTSAGGTLSLGNVTLYIWNSTSTLVYNNTINISGISNSSRWDFNFTYDDVYNWNGLTSSDNGAENEIAAANRTIEIDTTNPSVSITSPEDLIDHYIKGNTYPLNWTISDVNLNSCWYYNGTGNTSITCGDNTTNINISDYSNRRIIVYANDTLGNVGSDTQDYNFNVFEISHTYNSSVAATKSEAFSINFSYPSNNWSLVTATLKYNNTNYAGTTSNTGDNVIYTANVVTPNIIEAVNKTFYWDILLTNTTGSSRTNSSSKVQQILPINMSLCSNPLTVQYMNFTAYDEQTGTIINASFEGSFDYGTSSKSNTFTYSYTPINLSEFLFCFTPPNEVFQIEGTIENQGTNYATRLWSFRSTTISNTSTIFPIYLLSNVTAQSFIIHLQDSTYDDVSGAIIEVERFYPALNQWKVVETVKTNAEGRTTASFETETVFYRFKIYVNNILVATSLQRTIFCQTTAPCTINLKIPGESTTTRAGFLGIQNLTSTLTYTSSTNTFTYTYTDTNDDAVGARLNIQRISSGLESQTICNTVNVGASGVISCDISSYPNGTYSAKAYNNRTSTGEQLDKSIVRIKDSGVADIVGRDGLLWSIFIILGIVSIGLFNPAIGIILLIAATIALSWLKIASIPIVSLVGIIAIGVILLWEMRR